MRALWIFFSIVLIFCTVAEARPRRCRGGKYAVPGATRSATQAPTVAQDEPPAPPEQLPEPLPTPAKGPSTDACTCDEDGRCECANCACDEHANRAELIGLELVKVQGRLDAALGDCMRLEEGREAAKQQLERDAKTLAAATARIGEFIKGEAESQSIADGLRDDLHGWQRTSFVGWGVVVCLGLLVWFLAVTRKPQHARKVRYSFAFVALCLFAAPVYAFPVVIHPVPMPPVNYQPRLAYHPLVLRPWLRRPVLHMIPVPAQGQPPFQLQLQQQNPAPTQ